MRRKEGCDVTAVTACGNYGELDVAWVRPSSETGTRPLTHAVKNTDGRNVDLGKYEGKVALVARETSGAPTGRVVFFPWRRETR